MGRRFEVRFQIDEDLLSQAIDRLDDILGDLDADAMIEDEDSSSEPEARELLDMISDTQNRSIVDGESGEDNE